MCGLGRNKVKTYEKKSTQASTTISDEPNPIPSTKIIPIVRQFESKSLDAREKNGDSDKRLVRSSSFITSRGSAGANKWQGAADDSGSLYILHI